MKLGDLRVWHVPQVPGKPFHISVPSVAVAKLVTNILAEYDLFQFENNIKPDYSNASGLEVFERDGKASRWCEWHDPETDDDINDYEVPA